MINSTEGKTMKKYVKMDIIITVFLVLVETIWYHQSI